MTTQPYMDTDPSFTLKVSAHGDQRKAYGCVQHTVFVSGWPYSLAYVRWQVEDRGDANHPAGSWTVYCMSRRDLGLDLVDTTQFTSREDALAFVRDAYIAALRLYEERCEKVRAWVAERLSPVETYARYANATEDQIIVGIIWKDEARLLGIAPFEMIMSTQEAITCMDWSEIDFFTPTIKGFVANRDSKDQTYVRWRHGFAEWRVPLGSKDYHVHGVRSLTGRAFEQHQRPAKVA